MRKIALLTTLAALAAFLVGFVGTTSHAASVSSCSLGGRTSLRPHPHASKLIVVVMENKDQHSVIGSKSAPFESSLARTYGYAAHYSNMVHPSLPNYLIMSSGCTHGVHDDGSPSKHRLSGLTIFGQITGSKTYAENMRHNCSTSSSGHYVTKHNPWSYFTNERKICQSRDLPFPGSFYSAVKSGSLPYLTFVIPNMINNTHDASVATGDRFLKRFIGAIKTSPRTWNTTGVIIAWDESGGGSTMPHIVVSRWTHHVVVRSRLDHCALLAGMEQLRHKRLLGCAKSAPRNYLSMFGL